MGGHAATTTLRRDLFKKKIIIIIKPLCVGKGQWRNVMQKQTKRLREGKRTRVLIRHLKNKIIRLVDSKCQLETGSRWEG